MSIWGTASGLPSSFVAAATEAKADEYAVRLGQGDALAAYLDTYGLEGDLPTPFKALGDTSHPWTEHRIDDLQARQGNG